MVYGLFIQWSYVHVFILVQGTEPQDLALLAKRSVMNHTPCLSSSSASLKLTCSLVGLTWTCNSPASASSDQPSYLANISSEQL